VTKADVAELVDARDLKFFATIDTPPLFWKTTLLETIENDAARRVLENTNWRNRAGIYGKKNPPM
jgi:hypothetical protein